MTTIQICLHNSLWFVQMNKIPCTHVQWTLYNAHSNLLNITPTWVSWRRHPAHRSRQCWYLGLGWWRYDTRDSHAYLEEKKTFYRWGGVGGDDQNAQYIPLYPPQAISRKKYWSALTWMLYNLHQSLFQFWKQIIKNYKLGRLRQENSYFNPISMWQTFKIHQG